MVNKYFSSKWEIRPKYEEGRDASFYKDEYQKASS